MDSSTTCGPNFNFSKKEASTSEVPKSSSLKADSILEKNDSSLLGSSTPTLLELTPCHLNQKTKKKWHLFSSPQDMSPLPGDSKGPLHVTPTYSYLSDKLRRLSTGSLQCSLFCGGQECKYENGSKWGPEDKALSGLYSHWVTPDIAAMARPCSRLIRDPKWLEEFKRSAIDSLITPNPSPPTLLKRERKRKNI